MYFPAAAVYYGILSGMPQNEWVTDMTIRRREIAIRTPGIPYDDRKTIYGDGVSKRRSGDSKK